jgi:hypothetical protein
MNDITENASVDTASADAPSQPDTVALIELSDEEIVEWLNPGSGAPYGSIAGAARLRSKVRRAARDPHAVRRAPTPSSFVTA